MWKRQEYPHYTIACRNSYISNNFLVKINMCISCVFSFSQMGWCALWLNILCLTFYTLSEACTVWDGTLGLSAVFLSIAKPEIGLNLIEFPLLGNELTHTWMLQSSKMPKVLFFIGMDTLVDQVHQVFMKKGLWEITIRRSMLIAKKQKSVPLRKKEKTDNHFDETMNVSRFSVLFFIWRVAT